MESREYPSMRERRPTRVRWCEWSPSEAHEWQLIEFCKSPGPPHLDQLHVFCRWCLTDTWHDRGARVEYPEDGVPSGD